MAARTEQLRQAMTDLERSYDITLEALGDALDLKDAETEGHSKRVTAFTIAIARAMDLPQERVRVIARGAFLHDIGKMAIPDDILRKPGRLSADEEALMLADILPTGYEVGVLRAGICPGDVVAVVGTGPVGLAAIVGSRLFSPAHIVAIDQRIPGATLPFEAVRDRIAERLKASVEELALRQYVSILAGQAKVTGLDLRSATSGCCLQNAAASTATGSGCAGV